MKAKAIVVTIGALVESLDVVLGDTLSIVDNKLPEAIREILTGMIEDRIMDNHPNEIEKMRKIRVDEAVSDMVRNGSFIFNDCRETEIFIMSVDIWEKGKG